MVATSQNFSFKCFGWKHNFFFLPELTWLYAAESCDFQQRENKSARRQSGGVAEGKEVKRGAVFGRMFLFVDETRTSWQRKSEQWAGAAEAATPPAPLALSSTGIYTERRSRRIRSANWSPVASLMLKTLRNLKSLIKQYENVDGGFHDRCK